MKYKICDGRIGKCKTRERWLVVMATSNERDQKGGAPQNRKMSKNEDSVAEKC